MSKKVFDVNKEAHWCRDTDWSQEDRERARRKRWARVLQSHRKRTMPLIATTKTKSNATFT